MILLSQTLRLFLDGIGRRDEYEFYLQRFQDSTTPAFAVVCPDPPSVDQAVEMLLFDLEFLLRLELVPLILLAGPEAEGMRETFAGHASVCGFFGLENDDLDAGADLIRAIGHRHEIPVLVDARPPRDVLFTIVPAWARRVHWVRPQGALRTTDGTPAWYRYTRRPNPAPLVAADQSAFAMGRDLVERIDGLHVSVTSPLNLLRELFTVKGAGTMIRRGSRIRQSEGVAAVDRAPVLRLLEDSFQRPVRNPSCLETVRYAYLEEDYRGAALVEEQAMGSYLSKFAVGTEARGEGLAQELWQEVVSHHPRLFWRSREGNPINHWYKNQADGRQRWGGWLIFWRGLPPDTIPDVVAYCLDRPADLDDSGQPNS